MAVLYLGLPGDDAGVARRSDPRSICFGRPQLDRAPARGATPPGTFSNRRDLNHAAVSLGRASRAGHRRQ